MNEHPSLNKVALATGCLFEVGNCWNILLKGLELETVTRLSADNV